MVGILKKLPIVTLKTVPTQEMSTMSPLTKGMVQDVKEMAFLLQCLGGVQRRNEELLCMAPPQSFKQ